MAAHDLSAPYPESEEPMASGEKLVCVHGGLERSCEICERNKTISEAVAIIKRMSRLIGKACPDASIWEDGLADDVDRWLEVADVE